MSYFSCEAWFASCFACVPCVACVRLETGLKNDKVVVLINIRSIASSERTRGIEDCDCELVGVNWV